MLLVISAHEREAREEFQNGMQDLQESFENLQNQSLASGMQSISFLTVISPSANTVGAQQYLGSSLMTVPNSDMYPRSDELKKCSFFLFCATLNSV